MTLILHEGRDEILVTCDEDGNVESAVINVDSTDWNLDCTDKIRESKFWMEQVNVEFQHQLESIKNKDNYYYDDDYFIRETQ